MRRFLRHEAWLPNSAIDFAAFDFAASELYISNIHNLGKVNKITADNIVAVTSPWLRSNDHLLTSGTSESNRLHVHALNNT